jgi:hypothetical protein
MGREHEEFVKQVSFSAAGGEIKLTDALNACRRLVSVADIKIEEGKWHSK